MGQCRTTWCARSLPRQTRLRFSTCMRPRAGSGRASAESAKGSTSSRRSRVVGATLLQPSSAVLAAARARRSPIGPAGEVTLLGDTEEIAVTESIYGPGERGPDLHVHRDHTDAWFVLEGVLTFEVEADARSKPGERGRLWSSRRTSPTAFPTRARSWRGSSTCMPRRAASAVHAWAQPRVRPARAAVRRRARHGCQVVVRTLR